MSDKIAKEDTNPEMDEAPPESNPIAEAPAADTPKEAVDSTTAPAAPAVPTEGVPTEAPVPQQPAMPTGFGDQMGSPAPAEAMPAAAPMEQPKQPFDLQGANTPVDTATYLKQADQAWANDLANGHIEPKTYEQMFAKKDTASKIGTLFGLLVSGVGSGLGHQQNAILKMMDTEIENDLEAQKQSKANAQNFIRLNQEHQLQEAQKGLYGAQANLANAEANIKTDALGHMQTNRSGLAKTSRIVQSLAAAAAADPTNQAKQLRLQQAQQAFAMVSDNVDAMNSNIADKAAATEALLRSLSPQASAAQSKPEFEPGVDMENFQKLTTLGKLGNKFGLNPAEQSQATKEAEEVNNNRAVTNIFVDSFHKLNGDLLAKRLTPAAREAAINNVLATIARETTGMYNASEAEAQAKALFPEVGDAPSTTALKFKKAIDHFKSNEAGTTVLDRYKLKKPFPKYPSKGSKFEEGTIIHNAKTGETQVRKNRHWVTTTGGE